MTPVRDHTDTPLDFVHAGKVAHACRGVIILLIIATYVRSYVCSQYILFFTMGGCTVATLTTHVAGISFIFHWSRINQLQFT